MEKGWIRPSTSPYGAPVVFAKKADGTLCFAIDYRALNNITIKNRTMLPRIDEALDHLRGAKYFMSLDLFSAYHQVPVAESDIYKTAFRTRYGHYEFTVMPFGLTSAPATCQTFMNNVLREFLDDFVLVYLDDIMIFSRTEEEHLRHVQLVLQKLANADLYMKASKCKFAKTSTTFLGFSITHAGISVDPKKIEAILNWSPPTTITEVRAFLGFTGFYRRFVRNYATIAAPLTALTSSTVPFPSTLPPSALDAFRTLQTALTTTPVLALPHTGPNSEFELYTASIVGLGAVLLQDGHPSSLVSSIMLNATTLCMSLNSWL